MMDGCYAYSTCVITSHYAHATDYGHDVYWKIKFITLFKIEV